MQKALARQAAIERELCKYLHLSCGHLQAYETFEVYRFAAKSGETYCENCESTVKIVFRRKAAPLPQEPMFLWHNRPARDAQRSAGRLELSDRIGHYAGSNRPE